MKLLHLLVIALSAAALVLSQGSSSARDVLCSNPATARVADSLCKHWKETPPPPKKVHPPPPPKKTPPPPKKVHPPPPPKKTPPPPPCKYKDGKCYKDSDCCKGLECKGYFCYPKCTKEGDNCYKNADCCKGLECSKDGFCYPPPPPCVPHKKSCKKGDDCCNKHDYCANFPNCYYNKYKKYVCEDNYVCDKVKKG